MQLVSSFRAGVAEILQVLRPLRGIRGESEMVQIDRHRHTLLLYHGAHRDRMKAVTQRLRCLPELHLEANYRGGISVRDRIVCADAAARRILTGLQPSSDATVSAFPAATPFTVDTKA